MSYGLSLHLPSYICPHLLFCLTLSHCEIGHAWAHQVHFALTTDKYLVVLGRRIYIHHCQYHLVMFAGLYDTAVPHIQCSKGLSVCVCVSEWGGGGRLHLRAGQHGPQPSKLITVIRLRRGLLFKRGGGLCQRGKLWTGKKPEALTTPHPHPSRLSLQQPPLMHYQHNPHHPPPPPPHAWCPVKMG